MDDTARLAQLHALHVLDSSEEPIFDAIVASAGALFTAPIALVTLIDENRQWFKARLGMEDQQTGRVESFCDHTIRQSEVLVVPDAACDTRFSSNPNVLSPPYVRFYAGAPITLKSGYRVGAVCVIDSVPRQVESAQLDALTHLATLAARALEQRLSLLEYTRAANALQNRLRDSEAFLERTGSLAGIGGWEVNLASGRVTWSNETCRIHQVPLGHLPSLEEAIGYYSSESRPVIEAAVRTCIESGKPWDLELQIFTRSGEPKWVRAVGALEDADDHRRLVGAFQDITVRRQALLALEASERRFRKLFQHSLGLICTHDMEGVLLSVNPAAARSLGCEVSHMVGRCLQEFMLPERINAFSQYLARMAQHGSDAGTIELIAYDGSLRYWAYHNVQDYEGDAAYVLGHAQDVTIQVKQERQLREWSIKDPLTGCFNRRALEAIERDRSSHPSLGCIVFDLDGFKRVNDTQGHHKGDEILVAMAWFLRAHVELTDMVVRLGGDEFLVLLPNQSAARTLEVARAFEEALPAAPIRFSLGSSHAGVGHSLTQAIREADANLYRARAIQRGSA